MAPWRYPCRFTPTSVGTTAQTLAGRGFENGSPPPAWGQRPRSMSLGLGRPVHPHQRGDNGQLSGIATWQPSGSPPPAWGQPSSEWGDGWCLRFTPTSVGTTAGFVNRNDVVVRFTPTSVGTTRGVPIERVLDTVHPHQRGDNWGVPHNIMHPGRFTPTSVGTTLEMDNA